jgi:hypothetical protein
MNLIYVRFINKSSTADSPVFVDDTDPDHPQSATVKRKGPNSVPSPKKAKISTPMPKSLSVTHMLKLGKLINKSTTIIHLPPSRRREAPCEGTNSPRLFTPGKRIALANSKVHQISQARFMGVWVVISLISKYGCLPGVKNGKI